MLQVRDIMTEELAVLSPEATIREAMELLSHHRIGGAPVVAGAHLVGVITATDLMSFAAGLSGVPTARDTSDVPDADDGNSVAGPPGEDEPSGTYFSEFWEDAGADVTERMSHSSSPEWNTLEEHLVSEAMTTPPLVTLPPTASALAAASLMMSKRVHRVLITDHGLLVGVVSALDLVSAAASGRLTHRTFVFGRV